MASTGGSRKAISCWSRDAPLFCEHSQFRRHRWYAPCQELQTEVLLLQGCRSPALAQFHVCQA